MKHDGFLPLSILRDRRSFTEAVAEGRDLGRKIVELLIISFLLLALYGAIIGSYHSWQQALSSAVKLPVLYLLSLFVCFPTLHIFKLLLGSKQTAAQHVAILLSCLAVTSVLLLGFAPVSLFFRITTQHYQFFKLLNVVFFAVTGFVGAGFMYWAMHRVDAQLLTGSADLPESESADEAPTESGAPPARPPSPRRLQPPILAGQSGFLTIWIILYGVVGSQLGWTLRPFFGEPHMQFELFRRFGGNFFIDIVRSMADALGMN